MKGNLHNTKRIAKNTIILYFRMVIVLLLALYTSRIVLNALGVDDFGLYNVVGGVVGLFTFLRTSMEKCTQRFLNVEMARFEGRLKDTFSVSLTIHILIAFSILIISETFGLWFLNAEINIPEGRVIAANWIYQSAIVSLCITVLTVPFSACVIAHEKMGWFAVVSILDALLKLGIAILITFDNNDRLISYGILMASISLINFLLYVIYALRNFVEVQFRLLFERTMFSKMFSFTGWTLIGQSAILGTNHGNNILVNMFHSVTANAAMSIGGQVNAAVTSLSGNFQTAFNPQITKSFASGDYDYLKSLIFYTSKISYFLLMTVSVPIMFNIDSILHIWLGLVPKYSGIFCILTLCNGILNALSAPLNYTVVASGNIKWFQIVTALVYLSDLLVVYILFSIGLPAPTVLFVKVGIMIIILYVRLYYTTREVPTLSVFSYVRHVLFPIFSATGVSIILAYLLTYNVDNGLQRVLSTILLFIIIAISVFFIGLSGAERFSVLKFIRSFFYK